jgi:wyosine [tRNA(Phe)-imidazoG37] synthetase (radical SAM superfamily)
MEDGRRHVDGLLPDFVFGPVDSRRYGKSLGINPVPLGEKVCSFDCPYCECGWTTRLRLGPDTSLTWPSVETLTKSLKNRLKTLSNEGVALGAITFAGNGEPTLHPEFAALVEKTRDLRGSYAPQALIVVLTNGTELGRNDVWDALLRVDEACFKLDAATPEVFKQVNLPHGKVSLDHLVGWLREFPAPIVQTMFVRGSADNTGDAEIEAWLETLEKIRPSRIDLYSLDRPTPDPDLVRVPKADLEGIAKQARDRLGIPVNVS